MTDPHDHTARSSQAAPDRPINFILPIVTAIVGFVVGFLLNDITKALAPRELKLPAGVTTSSPDERDTAPVERDARPVEPGTPPSDAAEEDETPQADESPAPAPATPPSR